MLQKVILFLSFLFIPFSHVSVDTMAVPASDSPTPVSELAAGEQLFEEMELGGFHCIPSGCRRLQPHQGEE